MTEYHLWRKRCSKCGGHTRAKRPSEVSSDAFGPRLKAVVTTLTAKYRVSRREVVAVLKDLFNVEISVGAVQGICEQVSKAVAPAVEALRCEVSQSTSVHADETGWPQKGTMHWLWGATTLDAAYFTVADNRGRDGLSGLLPDDYAGIVHCDRWRPYQRFGDSRQLCHTHLRRDFQAAIDRGGAAKPVGQRLLALSDRLFAIWHVYDRGDVDRRELQRDMKPVQVELERVLEAAIQSPDRKQAALGADLFLQWDPLWSFLYVDGVEPTNNDAERALRPAVLWRKGSFGSRSNAGSQFVGRLLTVIHTARRRNINVVQWLQDVCANGPDFCRLNPPYQDSQLRLRNLLFCITRKCR